MLLLVKKVRTAFYEIENFSVLASKTSSNYIHFQKEKKAENKIAGISDVESLFKCIYWDYR